MLDFDLFQKLTAILCEHFSRNPINEFVEDTWYNYLSERLSNGEFELAVRRAVINCEFMPTPKKLVEFVHGDTDTIASGEFDKLVKAAAAGKSLSEVECSQEAKFAILALGGMNALGLATEDRLPWIKREFKSLFKDYRAVPRPMLAASNDYNN